ILEQRTHLLAPGAQILRVLGQQLEIVLGITVEALRHARRFGGDRPGVHALDRADDRHLPHLNLGLGCTTGQQYEEDQGALHSPLAASTDLGVTQSASISFCWAIFSARASSSAERCCCSTI